MVKLTKQQRQALWRVFVRVEGMQPNALRHYRRFRKTVQPGPDCVMVPFAGMWLGIEKDGYTHS